MMAHIRSDAARNALQNFAKEPSLRERVKAALDDCPPRSPVKG